MVCFEVIYLHFVMLLGRAQDVEKTSCGPLVALSSHALTHNF